MNMYWLYELPNWLFGVLTIAVTAAVGLSGLHTTRRWVRRVHGDRHSHNEVVGYYLSAVCVFYGIIGALDSPFRGEISVSPELFEIM